MPVNTITISIKSSHIKGDVINTAGITKNQKTIIILSTRRKSGAKTVTPSINPKKAPVPIAINSLKTITAIFQQKGTIYRNDLKL